MAAGGQWLVLEGKVPAARLSEAFCPALSSRRLGHFLVEMPKALAALRAACSVAGKQPSRIRFNAYMEGCVRMRFLSFLLCKKG